MNENVRGEIKLSVQYHRGALTVMVRFNKFYSNMIIDLWLRLTTIIISDLPRTIIAANDRRSRAKYICENLLKTRSNEIHKTQNQSRSQELLSKLHGNGETLALFHTIISADY